MIFFRTAKGKAYSRHLAVVHDFTKAVIRARKLSGAAGRVGKRLAFLDLLLETRDQDGQPLSEQDIREEVDTFMFEVRVLRRLTPDPTNLPLSAK